jgi:hypothetical protein
MNIHSVTRAARWLFKSIGVTFPIALAFAMAPGCTYSLVHDYPTAAANVSHCSGSENIDDSSIAVVPIPAVAFFSPHTELHQIEPDDYLNRCGPSTRLVNRDVTLDKSNCVPAALTELLTLGIWQWCPANLAYSADVMNSPAAAGVASEGLSSSGSATAANIAESSR